MFCSMWGAISCSTLPYVISMESFRKVPPLSFWQSEESLALWRMPQDRFQPADTLRHKAYCFAATCCAILHFGLALPGSRVILAELSYKGFHCCFLPSGRVYLKYRQIIKNLLSRRYHSMSFQLFSKGSMSFRLPFVRFGPWSHSKCGV